MNVGTKIFCHTSSDYSCDECKGHKPISICHSVTYHTVWFQDILTSTQQNYYGWRCGTLLRNYCTGTYTEVTVLLLWGNCVVTMENPHGYSVGVPVWVLQGNIGATSTKQHCYFSVDTSNLARYENNSMWAKKFTVICFSLFLPQFARANQW